MTKTTKRCEADRTGPVMNTVGRNRATTPNTLVQCIVDILADIVAVVALVFVHSVPL